VSRLGTAHTSSEALLFSLGSEVFAFPIGQVRQVLRACWPQPVPRPPLGCLGVIEVAGEVVPVLDLAVLLALRRPLPPAQLPEKMLDTHFLLCGAEEGEIGFWVNRVIEVAEIRALENAGSDPRVDALGKSASWVVGLAVVGDRRALVLDPSAVVTASRRRLLRRAVLRKAV
jgi:purine-binding chemotaxis protein CheW